MCRFFHRHSPSPRAATQWYCPLLFVAYGLATVHALVCIVNGDDSAVFRFFFFPGDLDLWPLTLTFELGRDFCTLYLTANIDRPTFSHCGVIVETNRLTDKQTPLKTSTALRYATPVGNKCYYTRKATRKVLRLLKLVTWTKTTEILIHQKKWKNCNHRDPQKTIPCAKTRHTTYRSLRSVHPFLHSWLFYPTPNPVLYNAFQLARYHM